MLQEYMCIISLGIFCKYCQKDQFILSLFIRPDKKAKICLMALQTNLLMSEIWLVLLNYCLAMVADMISFTVDELVTTAQIKPLL